MKPGTVFRLCVALALVGMMLAPGNAFAFRAEDEGADSIAELKAKTSIAGDTVGPALSSVLLRDLNQPVSGDVGAAARTSVNNLIPVPETDTKLKKIQVDSLGYRHVRLAQRYKGLPVVGGEFIVHINDENVIYQINGKYLPETDISIEPTIDANAALQVGLTKFQQTGSARVTQEPTLVIYGPRLAYHFVISCEGDIPERWVHYVDAHSGKLLLRFNDIKYSCPPGAGAPASVSGNRLTGEDGSLVSMTGYRETAANYFLWNYDQKWGVYDEDAVDCEQQATSTWGSADRAAVSLGYNFSLVQDYVTNVLGRNSFDDAGALARGTVHYWEDLVNAYWGGEEFYFGDGDGVMANALTVLDVVGHEYGHAVTQYTSNLVYAYEPGALNEAYSDIMGAVIEFANQPDGRGSYPTSVPGYADWLMGEDCWLIDDALRDMRDPQRYQLPSYYHGTWWYYGSGDNGGVHYNCGVGSFAFYLLSEGGTGTNDGHPYDIVGIGWEAAAEIAFRANMYYHIENAQYWDARQDWVSAADDLGHPTATVKAVWTACGVVPFVPPSHGYEYDDGVPFTWFNISTTGTPLNISDENSAYFALPFDVMFYGKMYDHICVSDNGHISFIDIGNVFTFVNSCFPTHDFSSPGIAVFWDDLNPSVDGQIYWDVRDAAPNRKLIIQYHNVPRYPDYGNATFEVVIYEGTGNILFNYFDVDFGVTNINGGASATVGLQESPQYAHPYSCNTASVNGGKSILWVPVSTRGARQYLQWIPSFDDTGAPELARVGMNFSNNRVMADVKDASSGNLVEKVFFTHSFSPISLAVIPDFTGTSAPELACLGRRASDGCNMADVRDASTDAEIKRVYFHWEFLPTDMEYVPDFGLTSAPELVTLARRASDGAIMGSVRDASSRFLLGPRTWFHAEFLPLDIEVASNFAETSAPELVSLQQRETDNAIISEVNDASSNVLIYRVSYDNSYYYQPLDVEVVSDFGGDTTAPELAMLRRRPDTGAVAAEVRDASTGTLICTVGFSSAYMPLDLEVVPDFGGGSTAPELVMLGYRESDDAVIGQMKDASSDAFIGNVSFSNAYRPKGLEVLPSFGNTSAPELAVHGVNPLDGSVIGQVKDASSGVLLQNVFFGSVFKIP